MQRHGSHIRGAEHQSGNPQTVGENIGRERLDGYYSYKGLCQDYDHKIVDHGSREYVRDSFHTNTIEGFWSHLKRGIEGVYHWVSKKYLMDYCGEFDFRYNTRTFDDMTRFVMFIESAYKRLKYGELTYPRYAWLWE